MKPDCFLGGKQGISVNVSALSFRAKVRSAFSRIVCSEVFRGSMISFGLKITGMLFSYLFIYLLSDFLGPEAVGYYTLAQVLLSILGMIVLLGMNTSIVKYAGISITSPQQSDINAIHKKMVRIVLFMSFIVGGMVFFISPKIAEYVFHNNRLDVPFKLVALVLPFYALCTLNAEALRGLKQILSYNILVYPAVIACSSLFLGVILWCHEIRGSVEIASLVILPVESGGIVALMASYVIFSIVSFAVLKRKVTKCFAINKVERGPSLRRILNLSFPMLITSSCYLLNSQADKVMIGMMKSTTELGVYNVAFRIAMATSIGLAAINTIVAPKVAGLYSQGRIKEMELLLMKSARATVWGTSPLLLICLCFPDLLLGFFGAEFKEGSLVLIFLIIGQLANISCGSVGVFLNMTGHQVVFRNILVISLLINIILNTLLTPIYGIEGAAFATAASIICWNGISAFYCKRSLNIRTYYLPLIKL